MNSLAIVVGDFNPEKYISDKLVASMSKIDSLIVHSIFDLLFFFVHLWHGARTLFRDVFTGIGAEITEQIEFGAFQKLGDASTVRKQGAV